MGYTAVRSHARRGYQVRDHSRRTVGRNVAEVLARDQDRIYEERDTQGPPKGIVGADPGCPHPAWYPVRHVDGTRILAYCCTHCAATRSPGEQV